MKSIIDSMTERQISGQSSQGSALAQLLQAAVALERQDQLDAAARLYQSVLAREPHHFDGLNRLGVIRGRQGQFDEAARLIRKAVARNPRSADAHNNLGTVLQALGRHRAAIDHYERALAINPSFAEAHNNYAVALQALDRFDEAMAHYQDALRIKSGYAEAHNNLGVLLQKMERIHEGIVHFERALALRSNYVEALTNLGTALLALKQPAKALAYCRKALALDPDCGAALNTTGNALYQLGRVQEAILHLERAIECRPGYAEAHNNLGTAFDALGRSDEAILHYERASALDAGYAEPHNNIGAVLTRLGNLTEARRAFERAVALAPTRTLFLANLADAKRFVAGDGHLAAMENLARGMSRLATEDQTRLHFALGKAYADLDQYDRSFDHLAQGNALKRRQITYDEAGTLGLFDRIQGMFDRALIRRQSGFGDPSSVPIFVMGMPRSGTTLVEQVLASHPTVFGAGELEYLGSAVTSIGGATPFPNSIATVSGEQLRELGAMYVRAINAAAHRAERITDKGLGNFQFVGLIHLALPNARIIYTRRDPLDTCFSCFSKLFSGEQPHTYDLRELGRYYCAYSRLMEHWRSLLPPGVMIEVQYESLVADFEQEARRMVAHCGLEWDAACLDFHKTRRAVRTASVAQVRQPIYQTSVGRWRPYKERLQPLIDELGATG